MNGLIIFFIGLLIPASKPCLSGFYSDGGPQGLLRGESGIQCLQSLPALEPKLKFANYFLRSPLISKFLILNSEFQPLLPHLDYLLGQNEPTTYLVLLQNNHEMRANGGFFGSYAVATIKRSDLSNSTPSAPPPYEGGGWVGVRFQDIYVPDGAIPGHVDPPVPIQTAFKQGWFKLRDADWEPDFPTAATTIRWFFEKGNEINPNVLLTLNLTTIEKIAKIIGEVDVPEYGFKLNGENLYTLLQNQSEIGAFPGSTQKKDILTAAGRAVIKKLASLKPKQYLEIGQIILDQLNHGNLLINSTNPEVQKVILAKDWAGQLNSPPCKGGDKEGVSCLNDTVLLVEANLGANKANCCVERKTVHTITKTDTDINHLINLTFTNNSPLENPLPPRFYGGNYISYLRFYLPENARNIRLTAQPTLPKTLAQYPAPFDGITNNKFDLSSFKCEMSNEQCEMRVVGFFHLTAAGTNSAVQLSYDLPLDNLGGYPKVSPGTVARRDSSQVKPVYQLNLLKQHGLESSPAEINLFGKTYSTPLDSDYSLQGPTP